MRAPEHVRHGASFTASVSATFVVVHHGAAMLAPWPLPPLAEAFAAAVIEAHAAALYALARHRSHARLTPAAVRAPQRQLGAAEARAELHALTPGQPWAPGLYEPFQGVRGKGV